MGKKSFIHLLIIVIIIFGGAAVYKNAQNKKIDSIYQPTEDPITHPNETIETKYQYKNGRHIFVGDIELPTPCHNFEINIIKEEETKIDIHTKNSQEMCVQQITNKTFKVSFEGDPDELIIASLNDKLVNLKIFQVPDNENIDEFEINQQQ